MPRSLASLALCVAFLLPASAAEAGSKDAKKLQKQLQDRDARKRAEAAWDLGLMGATEAVPALAAALEDASAAVRANAAASLWKLGEASKPAEPALRAVLFDESSAVVSNAAGALAKLGVPAEELIPAYRGLLGRPDCEARVRGLKGLVGDVPPTELFEHAWDCSHEQDLDTSRDASEALREILDRKDHVMVPQLLEALRNLGNRNATYLALALGGYKPPAKESVPVLAGVLDTPNPLSRAYAATALGRMGEASLAALPQLIQAMESDTDPDTRENAAAAIGEIGAKGAKTAVPALMKAAENDEWPKVRQAALGALGRMREHAREAIPVLRKALRDPDGHVSVAARNALFRVDPENKTEVADISDASRPVEQVSLFEDLSQLSSTLPGKVPEVYELMIYGDFAMATTAVASSPTGYGTFTYRAGTLSGPEENHRTCDKRVALAKVDFDLVPKLIATARSKLGAPSAKVSYVSVGGGIFCKRIGWTVYLEGAGMVEFKLDGKVDRVQKM